MNDSCEVGARVKWQCGDGWAKGMVTDRFPEIKTLTLKGTLVTHDASEYEPAYLIEQHDGDQVLKSHTQLETSD